MKNPLRSLGLALFALSAASLLTAQNDAARAKFSDPSKPGTLKFALPWADVKITGTDGPEVVVRSSLEKKKDEHEAVDADGFRRLDDDASFELKERDNVVTLSVSGDRHMFSPGTEFDIQVPRNTHLIVRTQLGGEVSIANIDGDIEVNSMNGEVSLTDITSSAVVNTMNGEIIASFSKAPTKPVSITTMNGEIDLRLPADTKANLRMRTHNGSIRTNFPDTVLVSKTERSPRTDQEVDADSLAPEAPPAPDAPPAQAAPRVSDRTIIRDRARTAVQLKDLPPEERARTEAMIERAVGDPVRNAEIATRNALRAVANIPRGILQGHTPSFGKSITGTLNGGGVDISLSSMNGTITLRKTK